MHMHFLLAAPCILLGAFGYRVRGSEYFKLYTGLGDFWDRLLAFAIPMGLTAFAAGAPYWLALGLVPVILLSASVGNFGSTSMGQTPDHSFFGDFFWLLFRGFFLTAPAAFLGAVASQAPGVPPTRWVLLVVAGFLISPVYALAWQLPARAATPPTFLANQVEYGELAYGFLLHLGLAAVFLAP